MTGRRRKGWLGKNTRDSGDVDSRGNDMTTQLTSEEERRAREALRPDKGQAEAMRRAHEEEMRELIRRQYGRTV